MKTVSEEEVIASHHRKNRYCNNSFLREFLTENQKEPATIQIPPIPPTENTLPQPSVPQPSVDKDDLRQFISAKLSLNMGMSCQEITSQYLQSEQMTIEISQMCHIVETVAEDMHQKGLIQATPLDGNHLQLQYRGRET